MARYRVHQELWNDGAQTHKRTVYEGEVAPEILLGVETLQIRAFGRRYCIDGRVFEEDRNVQVRGVTCSFELVRAA